jgi:hypothetical protein
MRVTAVILLKIDGRVIAAVSDPFSLHWNPRVSCPDLSASLETQGERVQASWGVCAVMASRSVFPLWQLETKAGSTDRLIEVEDWHLAEPVVVIKENASMRPKGLHSWRWMTEAWATLSREYTILSSRGNKKLSAG